MRSSVRRSPTCGRPGLVRRVGMGSSADGGGPERAGGERATRERGGPKELPAQDGLCSRGWVGAVWESARLAETRKCWRSRSSRNWDNCRPLHPGEGIGRPTAEDDNSLERPGDRPEGDPPSEGPLGRPLGVTSTPCWAVRAGSDRPLPHWGRWECGGDEQTPVVWPCRVRGFWVPPVRGGSEYGGASTRTEPSRCPYTRQGGKTTGWKSWWPGGLPEARARWCELLPPEDPKGRELWLAGGEVHPIPSERRLSKGTGGEGSLGMGEHNPKCGDPSRTVRPGGGTGEWDERRRGPGGRRVTLLQSEAGGRPSSGCAPGTRSWWGPPVPPSAGGWCGLFEEAGG